MSLKSYKILKWTLPSSMKEKMSSFEEYTENILAALKGAGVWKTDASHTRKMGADKSKQPLNRSGEK